MLTSFKSPLTYLLKNGSLIGSRNVVIALCVLLTSVAAANLLSPEVYGTYKYLIGIGSIASAFCLTGARESLVRAISKDNQFFIADMKKWSFLIASVAHLIPLSIALYYFWQGNMIFGFSLLAAALLRPLYLSHEVYRAFLNGTERYKELTTITIVSTLVTSSLTILSMYLTGNPMVLVVTYFLSEATLSIIADRWISRKYTFRQIASADKRRLHEVIKFAVHLSIMRFPSSVVTRIESIIVFHFIGPSALAILSFAKAPVDQMFGQRKILRTLLLPRFSKYSPEAVREHIFEKVVLLFVSVTVLVFLYISCAPYLFSLLFPSYTESVHYSQWLSLLMFAMISLPYFEALTSQKQTRKLYLIETISPLIKLLLLVILVFMHGILGVVIAIVASELLRSAFIIILYYTNLPILSSNT